MLDRGSFVGFCGPLVNFWLDHFWTVLDSWVISSLGFQMELFVSLPCSEGPEWVVSLEISAGFIGWKFGWLEMGDNRRFAQFKSPSGRIVGSRVFMQCPHPCEFCINSLARVWEACGLESRMRVESVSHRGAPLKG